MELWEKWFKDSLSQLNLNIDDDKFEKFKTYLDLIIFYNKKFNLTGEKTKEDIAIKQFVDSLIPIVYENENKKNFKKIVDIGTGAGIPGIPIKIYFEDITLYLIESNKKRCSFLNELIRTLSLKNVFLLEGRAEEIIKKEGLRDILREKFDSVFSRWVLKIPGIFELVAPYVTLQGKIFLWKGVDEIELIMKNTPFLQELGVDIENIFKYELPYYRSERVLLVLKKIRITPEKYPRSFKRIRSL
ncbi:MAG: 16S rRNA (guanine(527)-N(7))-methyltransferase RsmG [Caldisericia bacterium]|jgi:16S rRNA (guanine527-N7)-methyltransferase|nr:16S rRNA (guanine(527)-N(7))-methyltransferase RsmG [Caldisericia bacterium]